MNNHKQVKDMLKNFYPFIEKIWFDKPAKIILNPDRKTHKNHSARLPFMVLKIVP